MRPRLEKIMYHQQKFDSMPETPSMGYFLEAWGLHTPDFDNSIYVERTLGKVRRSRDPIIGGTHANTRIKVQSFPLGINWEFDFHPRRLLIEFGDAWITDHNGHRQRTTSSAPTPPARTSVWMDTKRHREREYMKGYSWVRLDTADNEKTKAYFEAIPERIADGDLVPYGPDDGVKTSVPGIYFKAWQPNNTKINSLILQVVAEADDAILRTYAVQLTHEPRFGIDAGDAYAFDILTATVENEMLNESWKHKRPPCPVCHEPLWTTHTHDGVRIVAEPEPDPEMVADHNLGNAS